MELKKEKTTTTWGTWEELLLASAVKRHGSKNWDSVALELQTRSLLPASAGACKQKYLDLRRRFTAAAADDADSIPWLEDLRKLRVAELRQEVQRYDVSILSLQSKVKRLEEERERSAEPNENGHQSPDLEDSKDNLSENDKNQPDAPEAERDAAGKSVSGDETDRDNRSFNESNSSDAKCENPDEDAERNRESARTVSEKPDPALSDSKAGMVEDSYNGSSEPNRRRKGDDSAELRDSVGQSKESSDVQSSASLTRKRKNRWRKEVTGGSSGEEPQEIVEDSRGIKRIAVKSRPFAGLLEAIRTHKHSSLFERRLDRQENDKYKKTIRQHMDLETIESRLGQGSYSSCTLTFYRDLMLLFNNAIVFFPKSSLESVSAHELRETVSSEMHKHAQTPDAPPEFPPSLSPSNIPPQPKHELERSDSLLAKHKSSTPIIVCRKRSSISTKPASTMTFGPKAEVKSEERKLTVDPAPVVPSSEAAEEENTGKATKEKPVTGTRTMRKSNKSQAANISTNKKQNGSSPVSADKVGTLRTEKKKAEALASEKKKSAADFLKRIKRNSPMDAAKSSSSVKGEQKKKNGAGKMENKGKDNKALARQIGGGKQGKEESSPSKRSVGRPPKKTGEAVVPAKRGRGEGTGKEASTSKRPKKRARR